MSNPFHSDWREAGRLLVKYRLSLHFLEDDNNVPIIMQSLLKKNTQLVAYSEKRNPLRPITETAVVAGLTEMIEGGGDGDKD